MSVEAHTPEPVEAPQGAAADVSPREQAIANLNAKIAEREQTPEPDIDAEAAEGAEDAPEHDAPPSDTGQDAEPEAEAAAEPDGEPDKPKRPSREERRRNYEAAMARRRARQAKERERRAQEMERELAAEKARIEAERQQLQQFEQRFQQDPYGAAAARLGITREQAVAMYADGQAEQVPAAVQQRLDRYEAELREMKEREQRQRQEREQQQKRQQFRQLVEKDVQALSSRVELDGGSEDWPAYAALPEPWRQRMAREAVHFWLKEDPDVHPDVIMDYLDEQAQPLVQSVRGNGRAADKKEATEQGQGTRAKTRKPRGASSARATTAPARRSGLSSPEELRQRAIEKLERRFAERRNS